MSIRETGAFLLWYFVIVTQCHQVSRTCRDSVETYSAEMGESPFMRDGWAVLQPTLTAQPSRSTQRTGPAVLLFLPALRALDFLGPVLVMMLRVTTLVW